MAYYRYGTKEVRGTVRGCPWRRTAVSRSTVSIVRGNLLDDLDILGVISFIGDMFIVLVFVDSPVVPGSGHSKEDISNFHVI